MLIPSRPDSRKQWHDQRVILEVGDHRFEVRAMNLSSTGALVKVPAEQDASAVTAGVEVRLAAYDSRGLEKFAATGRAVRVRVLDADGTEVGIEFNVIDL